MYERFTDRARKIMQLANREAQRFNHEYIGTMHIVLGLMGEGTGVAANVLKNLGVDLQEVRMQVEQLVRSGRDLLSMGKLPQTPRAKKVIAYAMEEARDLNHKYVGSEHVLLGLLREEEGAAAQVLMNFGVTLEKARAEVCEILNQPAPDQAAKPARNADSRRPQRLGGSVEEPPEVCPECGGQNVVRILWDSIPVSSMEQEEVAAGRAILAGRTNRNAPSWACLTCEPRWSEVPRLASLDHDYQVAKEEAVRSHDWDTAAQLRDAQDELRPRLAALIEELLGGQ